MSTENTANTPNSTETHFEENRWVTRLEELLKVKNLDELKTELTKVATEIQAEIQGFDINEHLSPEAKSRLKKLEQRYNEVIRGVHKAQKQFDREFNKSLRVLKRTRQDAEKQIQILKTKVTKHRGTIVKASSNLKNKVAKATKKTTSTKTIKKAVRKTKTKKASN